MLVALRRFAKPCTWMLYASKHCRHPDLVAQVADVNVNYVGRAVKALDDREPSCEKAFGRHWPSGIPAGCIPWPSGQYAFLCGGHAVSAGRVRDRQLARRFRGWSPHDATAT